LRCGEDENAASAVIWPLQASISFGDAPLEVGTLRPVLAAAMNADTVEKLSIGLLIASIVGSLFILRSGLKIVSKLLFVAVLFGLGLGIFQNRVELGRCSQTCSCAIYGHDVDVPHLPFSCDY